MSLRYTVAPGGSAVVITDAVLATMNRFRQIGPKDREAGGQFFARFNDSDTVIVEATCPKFLDRRSRCGFKPNRWLQRREIRERYHKGLHFVGDWHTHPEPFPRPSQEDFRNMQECFRYSLHDLQAFVMIIVGNALVPAGLHVTIIQQDAVLIMTCETPPSAIAPIGH